MNTPSTSSRRRLLALTTTLILGLLLAAPHLSAAVEKVNGDDPKITTDNTPFIAWTMVVVFGLGILAISFKTSKRTLR